MVFEEGVVVTGLGLTTPLGGTCEEHLEACRKMAPGLGYAPLPEGMTGAGKHPAALAPALHIEPRLKFPKMARFIIRSLECGLDAAFKAVSMSGADFSRFDPERIAIHVASGQTGLEYNTFFPALELAWENRDTDFRYLGRRESRLIDRYFSLRTLSNAGIALLSMELGAQGCSSNQVQGDPGFSLAVRSAVLDLLAGRCDAAVAGGYDNLYTPTNYISYQQAGLLADRAECRPFDRGGRGLVPGEGAAFFVLEREETSLNRGARILARITGCGSSHLQANSPVPEWTPDQLTAAANSALGPAQQPAFAVAHGIGLPMADLSEAKAFTGCHRLSETPVTALKGLTGYLGAATGAVEFGLAVCCAGHGFVPAVAGLNHPIEQSMTLVAGQALSLTSARSSGILISRAWGGQLSALSFEVPLSN